MLEIIAFWIEKERCEDFRRKDYNLVLRHLGANLYDNEALTKT